MTQTKSERIHRDQTARKRRSEVKDILHTKVVNFFRRERWRRKKKQK